MIKKWIITGTTMALLSTAGYFVGDWDSDKGYPVIRAPWAVDSVVVSENDSVIMGPDTVWIGDSVAMSTFVLLGRGHLCAVRLGSGE